MSVQHTPGPWVAGIHDGCRVAIWRNGIRLAEAFSVPFDLADQIEANARLIAEAPELLAALEALCAYLEDVDVTTAGSILKARYQRAREAMAKARGGK